MNKVKFSYSLALIVILFFAEFAFSQYPPPSTNFRIFPSTTTQTEPIVCISPLNRLIMFGSSYTINTSSGFISVGVYISTNGGYNWFGSDTCKGQNIQNYGGDPGVSIDKNGTFIITHIGKPSVIAGVYSHYSTNMGANWSNAYTISSQQPEDKGSSTTDNSPSSLYYGRTYAAWVNLNTTPPTVQCSHSTNSGVSWSAAKNVNPSPPQRCTGGYIETGKDGTVYISWAGASGTFPFPSQYAGFAFSTNGDSTWTVYQNIYSISGIEPTIQQKSNIRVNSIPRFDIDKTGGPRNGWIYMVSAEKGAGADSADIILHRSSNNGLNWTSGIRVNQDAHNNGKTSYCPAICVDSTGAVNILFYDDRNTTSDSAEVLLARSKDGGNTWTEFKVSSHKFKPKPIAGTVSNYQGDFISIISSGNKLFTYWMDDYSGIYQCWSSVIDLNTIGIRKIESEIPSSFELSQNYPNPFNPVTKINFTLPNDGFANLKIYDIRGIEVASPVNEELNSGKYEITFNAANLASGTYFYKLEYVTKNGNKFSQTKKLVVLK
jgi:hypothetical protein